MLWISGASFQSGSGTKKDKQAKCAKLDLENPRHRESNALRHTAQPRKIQTGSDVYQPQRVANKESEMPTARVLELLRCLDPIGSEFRVVIAETTMATNPRSNNPNSNHKPPQEISDTNCQTEGERTVSETANKASVRVFAMNGTMF
jgi:hypothetical protein